MFNRRRFLTRLGRLPLLGGLLSGTVYTSCRPKGGSRDLLQELGVKPFINAAGTYTMYTASLMPPEVMEAMVRASRHFVHLSRLQDAVGERIAHMLGVEAAMVTSGAAGALAVGTAACITGSDPEKIKQIPDLTGLKSEVLIQKSHRFAYDHSVRACGIRMVEIETREELSQAVSEKTALMLFFNDAEPRGQIKSEEWVALGGQFGVPTFNDAAADVPPVENLSKYVRMGFDLVAFSGGKGLRGPQSAGLLLGRRDLIEAAKLNTSPNSDTIARGMKVNKEEMIGMLVALELYLERDHAAELREWERRANLIAEAASSAVPVEVEIFVPPIANHVPHLRLKWDPVALGLSPVDVRTLLSEGDPAIEVNPQTTEEELVIGVWMMEPGDAEVVARRLQEVLKAASA